MTKSINEPLRLNLQYFAEEDPPSDPPADPPEDPPAKLELTQEELDKKIEAEADRKLSKSLEKKQKEWEKQFNERVKAERDEADKLAKLSQKERDDVEYQKKIDALTEREQALQKQELRVSVVNELNEKQLPSNFADFLLGVDADKTFENIGSFKKTFDEAIENKVNERLKGDPPKVGNTGGEITKEQFNKMGYSEREKLFTEKPDSYNKLIK